VPGWLPDHTRGERESFKPPLPPRARVVRFEELRRHRVVRRRVMRGDSIVAESADTFVF